MLNNNIIFINTQQALDDYVLEIQQYNVLAIDTEFNRNNKEYLPQLCLIQISHKPNLAVVIDCLCGLDLSKLIDCIYNENIVKVFHACRQDIEMLFNITQKVPKNIFDTQIAVLAMNVKKEISYDNLVSLYLNINLDKSLKNSKWQIRPLNKAHIHYAALDALYLYQCYIIINKQLQDNKRLNWLNEAFLELQNPDLYTYNAIANAKKFSHGLPTSLHNKVLNIVLWREQQAKENNISRNSILDNHKIKHLALKKNNEHINLKSFINPAVHNSIEELQLILNAPEEDTKPNHIVVALTENQKDILHLLKLLLQYCSNKYNINDNLIASLADLTEILVKEDASNHKIFLSWRKDIFGDYVTRLLNGKIGISMLDNKVTICG